MGDGDLCYLSVHDLAGRIRRREVSPVEVVETHLRRIEALNPGLSAFFTLTGDRALEEARLAEAEIAAGRWRGPLHGVPYGAKDIIETAGIRTTHGSSFFRDHVPAEDADCMDQYVRGLRERELLRREAAAFYQGADAFLLPSMPCTAPPIATLKARVNGKEYDGVWIHRSFQSPHNLTGCPAVSLPMGFDQEGLPLSLQIVGPEWSEARVLAVAHAYEEATPEIHARRPPGA